ncbi:hypothetical protein NE237_005257 [Protea cynaroides]|uniref:Uncharacterized protein n=1 Tax=Protea cynaroides TaxID=273540 RepID=A0A9Q0KK77_9MAGN|nr:hypothetical protein NE237_005257 [Protea cynaroides]
MSHVQAQVNEGTLMAMHNISSTGIENLTAVPIVFTAVARVSKKMVGVSTAVAGGTVVVENGPIGIFDPSLERPRIDLGRFLAFPSQDPLASDLGNKSGANHHNEGNNDLRDRRRTSTKRRRWLAREKGKGLVIEGPQIVGDNSVAECGAIPTSADVASVPPSSSKTFCLSYVGSG